MGGLRNGLAVTAARLLLEELSADLHGEVPLVKDAARAAQAVLSLVEARVRLLDMAVGRELDPGLLVARHNLVHEVPEGDEPDFYVEVAGFNRPRQDGV